MTNEQTNEQADSQLIVAVLRVLGAIALLVLTVNNVFWSEGLWDQLLLNQLGIIAAAILLTIRTK